MFDKLRNTFSKFVDSIISTIKEEKLNEKELNKFIDELYLELIENDVAVDVADAIIAFLRDNLRGVKIPRFGEERGAVLRKFVFDAVYSLLSDVPDVDLISEIKTLLGEKRPIVLLFLGPNGYGKTTTLAKLAYRLKREGIIGVLAAADTFRAGAREQLEEHGRRIGLRVIGGPYGADPASVAYDAVNHAKSKKLHAVLIDTAGRMHTDANLMEELKKIQRVVEPDFSIFVFDAQLGNEALEIAKYYNKYVRIDGMIAAKADSYPKGGSILTFLYAMKKPIYFLGIGQTYEDLAEFNKTQYLKQLLS